MLAPGQGDRGGGVPVKRPLGIARAVGVLVEAAVVHAVNEDVDDTRADRPVQAGDIPQPDNVFPFGFHVETISQRFTGAGEVPESAAGKGRPPPRVVELFVGVPRYLVGEQVGEGLVFRFDVDAVAGDVRRIQVIGHAFDVREPFLEVVLERMADFTEKNHKLKGKIKSALTYPILVVFIAVSVLVFLIAFIIPKFMELFAEIGATLPLPTMILMSVSDFLRERWYVCVAVLVAIVAIYNVLSRMKRMRFYIDRAKLHLPIFGALMRKMSIANFSRTLSTLTASGVPILQALDITKDTLDNEVIIRALTMTYESIREGESMAAPLKASGVFSAMVVNMVEVGEETGSLEQMLAKVADVYEGEVDATVSALTSLLEPLLIVTIGIIVGFIVVAMFLPLIKLLTALSI